MAIPMLGAPDILQGKILIVDDKPANVLVLEGVLRRAGYVHLSSTTNSGKVCDLHRDNAYDLILLDLHMPAMDGFQVMNALSKMEPDGYIPVIAVTAHPEHKLRALNEGAKDFISKPFDFAEVLLRVHNVLQVRLLHLAAREHARNLEDAALTDPLTGLANRRLLADRMSMALVHARRNKSPMAVVCLDLDGFKPINDSLGHDAGDLVLKTVAGRLLAAVREHDTVARVGGDEFTMVLWSVIGAEQAAMATQRALCALAQPCDIQGHSVSISASAGIALYPAHGEAADALTKSADLALYEAKRAGKNTYRIAASSAEPTAVLGPVNI